MPTVTNHSDMELEVPAIGAVLAPGQSVEVTDDDAPLFHGHGVLTLSGWEPPADAPLAAPVAGTPGPAQEPEEGDE